MDQQKKFRFLPVYKVIVGVLAILFAGLIGAVLMLRLSPKTGAYGADFLRNTVGNQPVTLMETALFQVEDGIKKTEFKLGLIKIDDPFALPAPSVSVVVIPTQNNNSTGPSTNQVLIPKTTANVPAKDIPTEQAITGGGPAPAVAVGVQPGEGVWQPYLKDASGKVVAYRTIVYPDLGRPYAYAAIVAFDLQKVQIHYVIGYDDPYAPGVKKISKGIISPVDTQSNLLLAAFNGGFKYEHGKFGSMANGFVSAPAQDGMGTLAFYKDGTLQIGEWGKDIQSTDSLVSFRQNGPLMIHNGAINPNVGDPIIWGRTITGSTATMRSGVAISPDQKTLYYFAGPSLTVQSLAQAMQAVHAQAGIQLDINNFWVHFVAIYGQNGNFHTVPLLAKGMNQDQDRFMKPYPRDFFYVTVIP